jgi:hypothetical protein
MSILVCRIKATECFWKGTPVLPYYSVHTHVTSGCACAVRKKVYGDTLCIFDVKKCALCKKQNIVLQSYRALTTVYDSLT